ncbi:MAG: hypothetical protein KGZ58_10055 [Ignavibacteriales bacterium]|nr:hypothetical protein [Ignavibacteriales bacterium]
MSEKLVCPICKQKEAKLIIEQDFGMLKNFDCQVCGNYIAKDSIINSIINDKLEGRDDLYILSGVIKHATFNGKKLELDTDNIDALIKNANTPKDIFESIDRILIYFAQNTHDYSSSVTINPSYDYPLIYSHSESDFVAVLNHCRARGYLNGHVLQGLQYITLTLKGWERVEELKKQGFINPKLVFMAMKFGDDFQDKIYNIFEEAVEKTGFTLQRLTPKAGLIDNRLRVEIRNCRFLLSDVTNENHGAYWEAGYAEGLGKQVIYLCRKKDFDEDKMHFDTNHHTTIIWDENNIQDAVEKLKATIRATFPSEATMKDEE